MMPLTLRGALTPRQGEPSVRWDAYSLQLASVKIHMCVVALTASIVACNINLVDEIFQP